MVLKRTIIIGGGEAASYVFHELTNRADAEYQIIGLLDDNLHVKLDRTPRLGGLDQLKEIVKKRGHYMCIAGNPFTGTC